MYFMLFIVLEVKLNVKPDVTAARHHEVVDTLVEVAGSGHAFGIERRFIVYHPKIAAYKRYIDVAYIAYPATGDGIADARFLKADVRRAIRIVLGQAAGTGNDLKPFLCIYYGASVDEYSTGIAGRRQFFRKLRTRPWLLG